MRNRIELLVLCSCSLFACGGSAAGTKHDLDANAGTAGVDPSDTAGSGATGGASGATNGSTGEGGRPVRLGSSSWDVVGDIHIDPSSPLSAFCYQGRDPTSTPRADWLDFALTVDDQIITVGVDGEQHSAPVQIIEGAYVAAIELPGVGCSTTDPLIAKELRFKGVDIDGDGNADRLEATATLEKVLHRTGDTGTNVTPSIELTATPDQSQPAISNGFTESAAWKDWNPLDRVVLSASEPLAPTATVALVGTSMISLSDPLSAAPVIAFSTSHILPLGGSWQLTARGEDLAGHPLKEIGDTLRTLTTLADPGVLAQNGFEGAPDGLPNEASIVTAYGAIPAISGAHSLWLEGSGFIHLQRSGNEQHLHFAVREFFGTKGILAKNVRAGVVGGTETVGFTRTEPASDASDATGDQEFSSASGVVHYDAVLTDSGTDVLLSISNAACSYDYLLCQDAVASAWMIDDLKLE